MRILIADNQPKVRFALRVTLERHPGLKTVSEAFDSEDLLSQAQAVHPDLILVDWKLQGRPGPDVLSALHDLSPDLRVIVLSADPEVRVIALNAGASAFVSKTAPPEPLLSAIDDCWRAWQQRQAKNEIQK
jgi:DNA-binding NarL/FixJ family response regulator